MKLISCEINGIYYKKNVFKKNRKTVIFIHGISSGSYAWDYYFKIYDSKYNIIALDLRGHGKSKRYNKYDDYKISKFSEDIYKVIKYEKIKKVNIVSHSFGNFIVFEFLKKHSKLVEKVVLLSAYYKIPRTVPSIILKKLASYNKYPIYGNSKFIDYTFYKGTGDFNIRRIYRDISNTGLKSYAFSLRNLYDVNYKNFLKYINIPCLIVHGENDKVFSKEGAIEISKMIKGSKIIIIKNANHILVLNNFNEVKKIVDNFIN